MQNGSEIRTSVADGAKPFGLAQPRRSRLRATPHGAENSEPFAKSPGRQGYWQSGNRFDFSGTVPGNSKPFGVKTATVDVWGHSERFGVAGHQCTQDGLGFRAARQNPKRFRIFRAPCPKVPNGLEANLEGRGLGPLRTVRSANRDGRGLLRAMQTQARLLSAQKLSRFLFFAKQCRINNRVDDTSLNPLADVLCWSSIPRFVNGLLYPFPSGLPPAQCPIKAISAHPVGKVLN